MGHVSVHCRSYQAIKQLQPVLWFLSALWRKTRLGPGDLPCPALSSCRLHTRSTELSAWISRNRPDFPSLYLRCCCCFSRTSFPSAHSAQLCSDVVSFRYLLHPTWVRVLYCWLGLVYLGVSLAPSWAVWEERQCHSCLRVPAPDTGQWQVEWMSESETKTVDAVHPGVQPQIHSNKSIFLKGLQWSHILTSHRCCCKQWSMVCSRDT